MGRGGGVGVVAVYVITGELGSGKSLVAVSRIQRALQDGCRIATNMDLKLEGLVGPNRARDVVRLPDWPKREDLDALGPGYQGRQFDEAKFGLMVLDEVGTFLNSREWSNDKDRMRLIHWLLHARKLRWHILLIVQSIEMIDKQIRSGLAEHVVKCRRLDRYGVPIVGWLTRMMGLGTLRMPQVHVGVVRYGTSINAPVVDKWMLWNGKQFHGAYDTGQKIMGTIDGPSTLLDQRRAPYLWPPRSRYDKLQRALGSFLGLPPSEAMQAHLDFKLWESGDLTPCQPAVPSYSSWLASVRAGRPGALGGEPIRGVGCAVDLRAGEAREPEQPEQQYA